MRVGQQEIFMHAIKIDIHKQNKAASWQHYLFKGEKRWQ